MTEYITVPVETDPDALVQDAFDYIQNKISEWTPSEGNLEVIVLEAIARMASEVRDVASDVPLAIFRYFGNSLLGIPPLDASAATGLTSWSMADTAGHTIPAGTLVGVPAPGDETIPFETVEEIVVPFGSAAANGVVIIAVEPGAKGSGLAPAAAILDLIDPLDFVTQVTSMETTVGGVDAEEDEDYLNRLASELQLLAPRPILPNDFAVLARRVPGVFRAIALDGYEPVTPSTGNDRTLTVAVIDEAGANLSTTVKNEVDALLEASREINFLTYVIDPTRTTIDVTFIAVAYSDWDIATVEADAEAAVAAYLSPATWGTLPSEDEHSWINQPKVRYLEVAEAINKVPGLHYISTLGIALSGGGPGTADVDLSGPIYLPQVGVITGTVNAP